MNKTIFVARLAFWSWELHIDRQMPNSREGPCLGRSWQGIELSVMGWRCRRLSQRGIGSLRIIKKKKKKGWWAYCPVLGICRGMAKVHQAFLLPPPSPSSLVCGLPLGINLSQEEFGSIWVAWMLGSAGLCSDTEQKHKEKMWSQIWRTVAQSLITAIFCPIKRDFIGLCQ